MLESIEELRTFVLVADEGSLSAVARRLRLSTNAVSRRIAKLEERVGTKLALRTTRRLRLTEEGLRLLERCRRIVGEVDRAETMLRTTSDGLSGLVRVALHPQLLDVGTLQKVGALLESSPELTVEVLSRNRAVDPVKEGLDLVVWPGEVWLGSVVVRKLATIDWVLAASPAYVTRRGLPSHPRELRDHECLRVPTAHGVERHWTMMHKNGSRIDAEVGGRFRSDDTATLLAAIHAGIGIGLRPRREVEAGEARGVLVHVLPRWRFGDYRVFLVSPPGRARLSRVRAVAAIIESAVAELM